MQEKIKCKICGKSFAHLGSHLWHGHNVLARDYKTEYGLPYAMSLISESVRKKKQDAFQERAEEYLGNLKKHGKKYTFKAGHTNHGVRMSEYAIKANIKRIEQVNKSKKGKLEQCPVCKMTFKHLESHLYNAHGFIKVNNK